MVFKTLKNKQGFTLLEVMIGAAAFSLGILGIIALQVSSVNSARFAANMGLGMSLASSMIEELMLLDYNDPMYDDDNGDGTNQDKDNDGLDDDDPADSDTAAVDNVEDFGLNRNCHTDLDPACPANADGYMTLAGWNGRYVLYWNVAVDEPIARTKTINMIITWRVTESEGNWQQVSFRTIRSEEL
jgi:type II secretory pathway pseudopilin PulG